jgi:hypothetical protein
MADNYPADEEIEQAAERAVAEHDIDIPDEYDMDEVVGAVKDDFFVDDDTAMDIIREQIWTDHKMQLNITDKGIAWSCPSIVHLNEIFHDDIPTYKIAREIVDIPEYVPTQTDVILGDWTHLWDSKWAEAPMDEVNYRIEERRRIGGPSVHKPDWVDRALEIYDETNLSWTKSKVIALLENDEYPEQQQIADLMDVSPAAISDRKRDIKSKIEDVEWLKATSEYF